MYNERKLHVKSSLVSGFLMFLFTQPTCVCSDLAHTHEISALFCLELDKRSHINIKHTCVHVKDCVIRFRELMLL
jgi:membrane protein CcdC involved in cytochrome C biogenesis